MLFLRPLSDLGLINDNSTYRWCFNKKREQPTSKHLRKNIYSKYKTQLAKLRRKLNQDHSPFQTMSVHYPHPCNLILSLNPRALPYLNPFFVQKG